MVVDLGVNVNAVSGGVFEIGVRVAGSDWPWWRTAAQHARVNRPL